MATKLILSNGLIEKLPEGTYYDEKQRGLLLKVTANSRTFQFYGWKGGRPVKKVIGKHPEMQLKLARIAAHDMWSVPDEPKTKQVTLDDLATRYVKRCETKGHRSSYISDAMRLTAT